MAGDNKYYTNDELKFEVEITFNKKVIDFFKELKATLKELSTIITNIVTANKTLNDSYNNISTKISEVNGIVKKAIVSNKTLDTSIENVSTTANKGEKSIKGLGTDIDKMGNKAEQNSAKMKKLTDDVNFIAMAQKIGLAKDALVSLANGITSLVDAAEIQINAENQLSIAMENSGTYTEEAYQSMLDYASAMQETTRYGDEGTLPMLKNLVNAGMDVAGAQSAMTVAMDVAAGSGKSLETITEALVKAQNGELSSLKEMISVEAVSNIEAIKRDASLTDLEKKTKMYQATLEALNSTYAGQASAMANSDGGITQLENAFGDLQEQLGTLLLPAVIIITDKLDELVAFVSNEVDGISIDWGWLDTMLDAITTLVGAIWDIGTAIVEVADDLNIGKIFSDIVDIVGYLAEGISDLFDDMKEGSSILTPIYNVIQSIWGVTGFIIGGIADWLGGVERLDDKIREHNDNVVKINSSWENINKTIGEGGNLKEFIEELKETTPELASEINNLVDSEGNLIGTQEEINDLFEKAIELENDMAKSDLSEAMVLQTEKLKDYADELMGITDGIEEANAKRFEINIESNLSEEARKVTNQYNLAGRAIGRQSQLLQQLAGIEKNINDGVTTREQAQENINKLVEEYRDITEIVDDLSARITAGTMTQVEAKEYLIEAGLSEYDLEQSMLYINEKILQTDRDRITAIAEQLGITENVALAIDKEGEGYKALQTAADGLYNSEKERLEAKKVGLQITLAELEGQKNITEQLVRENYIQKIIDGGREVTMIDLTAASNFAQGATVDLRTTIAGLRTDVTNVEGLIEGLDSTTIIDENEDNSSANAQISNQNRAGDNQRNIIAQLRSDRDAYLQEQLEGDEALTEAENLRYANEVNNIEKLVEEYSGAGDFTGLEAGLAPEALEDLRANITLFRQDFETNADEINAAARGMFSIPASESITEAQQLAGYMKVLEDQRHTDLLQNITDEAAVKTAAHKTEVDALIYEASIIAKQSELEKAIIEADEGATKVLAQRDLERFKLMVSYNKTLIAKAAELNELYGEGTAEFVAGTTVGAEATITFTTEDTELIEDVGEDWLAIQEDIRDRGLDTIANNTEAMRAMNEAAEDRNDDLNDYIRDNDIETAELTNDLAVETAELRITLADKLNNDILEDIETEFTRRKEGIERERNARVLGVQEEAMFGQYFTDPTTALAITRDEGILETPDIEESDISNIYTEDEKKAIIQQIKEYYDALRLVEESERNALEAQRLTDMAKGLEEELDLIRGYNKELIDEQLELEEKKAEIKYNILAFADDADAVAAYNIQLGIVNDRLGEINDDYELLEQSQNGLIDSYVDLGNAGENAIEALELRANAAVTAMATLSGMIAGLATDPSIVKLEGLIEEYKVEEATGIAGIAADLETLDTSAAVAIDRLTEINRQVAVLDAIDVDLFTPEMTTELANYRLEAAGLNVTLGKVEATQGRMSQAMEAEALTAENLAEVQNLSLEEYNENLLYRLMLARGIGDEETQAYARQQAINTEQAKYATVLGVSLQELKDFYANVETPSQAMIAAMTRFGISAGDVEDTLKNIENVVDSTEKGLFKWEDFLETIGEAFGQAIADIHAMGGEPIDISVSGDLTEEEVAAEEVEWDRIGDELGKKIGDGILGIFQKFLSMIIGEEFASFIVGVLKPIMDIFSGIFGTIGKIFRDVFSVLAPALEAVKQLFQAVGDIVYALWTTLKPINDILYVLIELIGGILGKIGKGISAVANIVSKTLGKFNKITDAARKFFQNTFGLWGSGKSNIEKVGDIIDASADATNRLNANLAMTEQKLQNIAKIYGKDSPKYFRALSNDLNSARSEIEALNSASEKALKGIVGLADAEWDFGAPEINALIASMERIGDVENMSAEDLMAEAQNAGDIYAELARDYQDVLNVHGEDDGRTKAAKFAMDTAETYYGMIEDSLNNKIEIEKEMARREEERIKAIEEMEKKRQERLLNDQLELMRHKYIMYDDEVEYMNQLNDLLKDQNTTLEQQERIRKQILDLISEGIVKDTFNIENIEENKKNAEDDLARATKARDEKAQQVNDIELEKKKIAYFFQRIGTGDFIDLESLSKEVESMDVGSMILNTEFDDKYKTLLTDYVSDTGETYDDLVNDLGLLNTDVNSAISSAEYMTEDIGLETLKQDMSEVDQKISNLDNEITRVNTEAESQVRSEEMAQGYKYDDEERKKRLEELSKEEVDIYKAQQRELKDSQIKMIKDVDGIGGILKQLEVQGYGKESQEYLSWLGKLQALENERLEDEMAITDELKKQNDETSEMDTKLRELLKHRQEIELRAKKQGGWTPELLTRYDRSTKEVANRMGELNFDPSSILTDSIPHFQEGGFVKEDTVAYIHGGEYVLPKNIVNLLKNNLTNDKQFSNIINNVNNNNINYTNNISLGEFLDNTVIDKLQNLLQNEAPEILKQALGSNNLNIQDIA